MGEWVERTGFPRGEIVPVRELYRLVALWYADRLDPDWTPRSAREAARWFADAGLDGPFWRLD